MLLISNNPSLNLKPFNSSNTGQMLRKRLQEIVHEKKQKEMQEKMQKKEIILNNRLYSVFGIVDSLADGIARITNFSDDVIFGEVVLFSGLESLSGVVMGITEKIVSVVLFFNVNRISEGDYVVPTGELVSIPIGKVFFGRVINTLGFAVDNKGTFVLPKLRRPIDSKAAGISSREAVYEPMLTGQLILDAITPIGLGQRELIIGDRQTGKTTCAWDTLINQCKDQYHFFIYSFIGQKNSFVSRLTNKYSEEKWFKRAIFISATCADSAPLQYMAAFSSCTIGEYIGLLASDAVVAYDDLSKQAVCYRQVSLLLRRPPGREAYPADVFYLHSRLLERAAKFHVSKGAGSSTALPVIETQLSDVSAYIPTNVISITDGQMFFNTEGFKKGIRPALDVNLSVSRVGSIAQWPIMRKLSAKLKSSLAQYKEVEVYASFAADLDASTLFTLNRGIKLIELLKQAKNQPLSRDEGVLLLFAGVNGYIDHLPKEDVVPFKYFLLNSVKQSNLFWELNPYKDLVAGPFEKFMDVVMSDWANKKS